MCKNTGVLFENDIIQVGVKAEFKDAQGASTASRALPGFTRCAAWVATVSAPSEEQCEVFSRELGRVQERHASVPSRGQKVTSLYSSLRAETLATQAATTL